MKHPNPTYELFFELSPDLMCIAGYDGYFKKVNPAVSNTLGYSMEELYATPINDFVHPDHKDITNKVRHELTRSKPLYNFENKYLTKGGETVWLSWTSLPVQSDELIFAVAKNVTHKKRLEADRNALLAELTRKNKDLVQLNLSASEDLKVPVTSLMALFDLIDLSRISDQETIQLLEVLQYAGEKIKHALNGQDEVLRNKNRAQTEPEETDMQDCLDQVLQSIAALIHTSKATVLADFSKARKVRFNTFYLKSLFLNLVTNAIKYAKPDCLPVISIHAENETRRTRLIISDNGSGFDAAKMKEEISSFPGTFQNNPESRGIGLFLIHSHVTSFGGDIHIESKINEGTEVVISFNR